MVSLCSKYVVYDEKKKVKYYTCGTSCARSLKKKTTRTTSEFRITFNVKEKYKYRVLKIWENIPDIFRHCRDGKILDVSKNKNCTNSLWTIFQIADEILMQLNASYICYLHIPIYEGAEKLKKR